MRCRPRPVGAQGADRLRARVGWLQGFPHFDLDHAAASPTPRRKSSVSLTRARSARSGKLGKLISAYIVGRQKWYLTREELTRYIGVPVVARGVEFRAARLNDLPSMGALTTRISRQTLRAWCGPDYYFFITLKQGMPISYRCLSRLVHPGMIGFVQLRPQQIFMVDEFTAPEFRRRGITRQMAIAMAPLLVADVRQASAVILDAPLAGREAA